MKEKKQHYKSRLKELIAFGDEYKDRMEKKVELLKSNLAKSESEVGSLDQIVEHTRKVSFASKHHFYSSKHCYLNEPIVVVKIQCGKYCTYKCSDY